MKVVFDVDDTLWSLSGKVCERLGLRLSDMDSFIVTENTNLTKEQQDAVHSEYRTAKNFENIKWFNGITRIRELIRRGVDVHINSNSCSERIAELKAIQLDELFHLPKDKVRMNIMTHSTCTKKKMDNDVDVFVDDSPYNVKDSTAKINYMIRAPWNTTPEALALIEGKNVVFCDDLDDVLNHVFEYIAKAA